jgi:tetratricopeptide (TPR) repeat protein
VPASSTGLLRIAETYRESLQVENAKAALRQATLAGVPSAATDIAAGNEYFALGDLDDAIATYKAAKQLDPTIIQEQDGLVKSFLAQHRLDIALGQAEEAVHLFPKVGASYVLLGNVREQRGETSQALALYQQATTVDPSYAQAYFEIGRLQHIQKVKLNDVAASYERGIVASPENDEGYAGLAHSYGNREIWQAVNRYTELEREAPTLLWPKRALGQSYEQWAKFDNALDAYNKAQTLAPDYATLYCRRGILLEQLERYDEAKPLLATCLGMVGPPPAAIDARQALNRIVNNARQVGITSPTFGATVSGVVTIRGTATDPRFQFYKIEYRPASSPNDWRSIGGVVTHPLTNGVLGTWDTAGLPEGDYVVRVAVVDESGIMQHPAEETIHVAPGDTPKGP